MILTELSQCDLEKVSLSVLFLVLFYFCFVHLTKSYKYLISSMFVDSILIEIDIDH